MAQERPAPRRTSSGSASTLSAHIGSASAATRAQIAAPAFVETCWKASILASQRREIVYCKPLPNVEPQWRPTGLGCVSIRQLPDQSFEYAAYSGSRANPRCAYPRWSSKLDVFDARSQVFRYASSFYQFEGDTLVKTDESSGEKTVHYPTEICVVDEQCFVEDRFGRMSSHSNCGKEG